MASTDKDAASGAGESKRPAKKPAAKKSTAKKAAAKKPAVKKTPTPNAPDGASRSAADAGFDSRMDSRSVVFMPEEDSPKHSAARDDKAAFRELEELTSPISAEPVDEEVLAALRESAAFDADPGWRRRLLDFFELETQSPNDYARAGIVVAATSLVGLVALVAGLRFSVALFAAIALIALGTAATAISMGMRGLRAADKGTATNRALALTCVGIAGVVAVGTVVTIVIKAVSG